MQQIIIGKDILLNRKGWLLTLHFGRGHSEIYFSNDKNEIFDQMDIVVRRNEDCVNAHVMKVG